MARVPLECTENERNFATFLSYCTGNNHNQGDRSCDVTFSSSFLKFSSYPIVWHWWLKYKQSNDVFRGLNFAMRGVTRSLAVCRNIPRHLIVTTVQKLIDDRLLQNIRTLQHVSRRERLAHTTSLLTQLNLYTAIKQTHHDNVLIAARLSDSLMHTY